MTKEEQKDFEDRKQVRELCSRSIAKLTIILCRLEEIRDVVTAIDIPTLSSYTKIEVETAQNAPSLEEEVKKLQEAATTQPKPQPSFKKKVDNLTDLTMTLARNLELQLKKE